MRYLPSRTDEFFAPSFNNFDNFIDSFFNNDMFSQRAMEKTTFKVDVSEDDNAYTVEAEMPGFEKNEVNVYMQNGYLTINAEKKEEINSDNQTDKASEGKKYIHKERRNTKVSRMMRFENVDEDKISAKLEKGVLEIVVPKATKQNGQKQISVN
ncbi:Hsp20/alpha crystallin family protein [Criibacterium bergeronii]|uniref:Hsp20/alpha crystallin family protein n=1 Tax=Criibacterium bergeronii TaxID=1871336 RepID=A0A552VCY7_9FIRM|nr:Hsp20/alpha crystallin family protein [Criibacterium bergeronii]TRW28341.1 Hsp20/alpha crystallin family protein [Criibacterium bergeronii]